jgi:hypothetical protein
VCCATFCRGERAGNGSGGSAGGRGHPGPARTVLHGRVARELNPGVREPPRTHACAMQFSAGVRPLQAYAPMPMLLTRAQTTDESVTGPPAPGLRPPAPVLKPVARERPPQQPSAQRSAAPLSRSNSQERQAHRASTPVNSMSANRSSEREQQQEKQFYSSTSTAAARAALLASAYASAAQVQPSYPSFACRTAPTHWHSARKCELTQKFKPTQSRCVCICFPRVKALPSRLIVHLLKATKGRGGKKTGARCPRRGSADRFV